MGGIALGDGEGVLDVEEVAADVDDIVPGQGGVLRLGLQVETDRFTMAKPIGFRRGPAVGVPRPLGEASARFLRLERVLVMSSDSQKKKFYALNMFDVVDVEKYLAYFKRLPEVAPQYGGRMVAFGRFRDNVAGDLTPRQVLFVVEWESEEAFNRFRDDPELADLHPLREDGTASYVWQAFDGLDMSDPADVALDDVLAVLKP